MVCLFFIPWMQDYNKNEILAGFLSGRYDSLRVYLPTNRIKKVGTIIRVHLQPNNKLKK